MLTIKVLFMPGTSKVVEVEEGTSVKEAITQAIGSASLDSGQTMDWTESTYKLNSEPVELDYELGEEDDMSRLLVAVKVKGE